MAKGFVSEWIRLARSRPIGLAETDMDAALVFQAALGQFEELMDAAVVTGPAASPLPIFYALSQAGKAIVAARGKLADRYGHGLRIDEAASILDSQVTPIPDGAGAGKVEGEFRSVSSATASEVPSESVAFGALAASLPEISGPLMLEDKWPQAMPMFVDHQRQLHLPVPGHFYVTLVLDRPPNVSYPILQDVMRHYPAGRDRITAALQVQSLSALPMRATPEGLGVDVLWRGTPQELDECVPEHRITGRRWLRPGTENGAQLPAPLMTWWALLYGLSHFARYRPAAWSKAIQIDSSESAVTIERVLDRALTAVPHLVLNALYRNPVFLPAELGTRPDPFSFLA